MQQDTDLSPNFPRSKISRLTLVIATIVLGCLAAAYELRAFKLLTVPDESSKDLLQRWVDEHYILRGENPFDVYFRYRVLKIGVAPVPKRVRPSEADPVVGPPTCGGYPPWSFFTGYALFSLPWNAERCLWAGVCLISLGIIGWAGYSQGRAVSARWELACFLAASVLAISTFGTCVSLGQFSVFTFACLLVAAQLDTWSKAQAATSVRSMLAIAIAGILLGMIMSKPQLAAPFLLVFLVRGRFGVLAVVASYLIVGSLIIWAVTRTDPFEMLHQAQIGASAYVIGSTTYGPVQLLAAHGVPYQMALLGVGLAVPAIAGAAMFIWRESSMLSLFGIAGSAGRLWTYHPLYDNGLLLFLLLAIGVAAAVQTRRQLQIILWTAFIIVGLTLWPRPKFCDIPIYQNFQLMVWTLAPAIMLWFGSGRSKPDAI